MKKITLSIDPALHRALKMLAAQNDRSLAELVHEGLKPLYLKALDSYGSMPESVNQPKPTAR